jgi:hypothetical protein
MLLRFRYADPKHKTSPPPLSTLLITKLPIKGGCQLRLICKDGWVCHGISPVTAKSGQIRTENIQLKVTNLAKPKFNNRKQQKYGREERKKPTHPRYHRIEPFEAGCSIKLLKVERIETRRSQTSISILIATSSLTPRIGLFPRCRPLSISLSSEKSSKGSSSEKLSSSSSPY